MSNGSKRKKTKEKKRQKGDMGDIKRKIVFPKNDDKGRKINRLIVENMIYNR